ncbi:hypothetical protein [Acerihabitans arboris]|uniref:Phage protein n=1 Tax=Acerihabitans arboris TaxID=2691583 RepID=A0A845ST45_9GAMM|nr:hypothetical protein [Acerihabitans arboris]NDL64235.1 hypothetical protein [Acerihabitans arboris]
MKNSLSDLNNHLFAQLERLSEESLAGEKLKEEICRTKAVTAVSKEIIANARLVLDAQEAMGGIKPEDKPDVLRVGNK